MTFPKDFLWGTATASYQIEGGGLSEGRGECIWHRFSHTPGKVKNGDTGDVACDHLHRYREDVALMADLGINAYRFSVSWSRVIPAGTGATNEQGLDFYDRLVDELLKHNIKPYTTLYHWDLPQALQDQGGWANTNSPQWFADYTDLITRRLGDRITSWITFNEPWCVSILGNLWGVHAPGLRDSSTAFMVAHQLNLAHGEGMRVIRQNCPGVPAGITLNLTPGTPKSDSVADQEALRLYDGITNRWFLDPVLKGEYPKDMLEPLASSLEEFDIDEVKSAAEPMDFLGVNYYTRTIVQWDDSQPLRFGAVRSENADFTAMDWEIYPQGLTDLLVRLDKEYHLPEIYITENGAAFDDPEADNGSVHDPQRVEYLRQHFTAVNNAIEQGVPVKGYFIWSFMDNFEWAEGYDKRFGIVRVNYDTQERTPKDSAKFVQQVIQTGEVG